MPEPGNVEQERLRESQKSHLSLGRPVKGRKSTPNAEPRLVGTANPTNEGGVCQDLRTVTETRDLIQQDNPCSNLNKLTGRCRGSRF